MSTGTAPVSAHTPTVGSLLSAELLRIRSRRFAWVVALGLLAVTALVFAILIRNTASPDAASIAAAREVCVSAARTDQVSDPQAACATVADLVKAGAFTASGDRDPAIPSDLAGVGVGVAIAVAVAGFLLGCTLGGADWSQRTMPALLFWEPRRVRLFAVKLLAFALTLLGLLLVALLLWWALYALLIGAHGTWDDGTTGLAGDLAVTAARTGVLVACIGLLGFGLANLTRSTGAALGAAFVYLAVIETFFRLYVHALIPWQLTATIGGLLADGGLDLDNGSSVVHISPWRAGATLVAWTVVVCGAAIELFRRRDVT